MPIPSEVRTLIDSRLAAIEADEHVHIVLAVESGSRGWGFPSPDSDYDVRFVYSRPRDDYLTLFERRDVIERPIEDDIDLSGWDLKKALQLILKPNAALFEWLESPIVYRSDGAVVAALRVLADKATAAAPLTHHYLRQVERHAGRLDSPESRPRLKSYFYVLRASLALRCLRLDPGARVRMCLTDLIDRAELDENLKVTIEELVSEKAAMPESAAVLRHPAIDALIDSEIEQAKALASAPFRRKANLLGEAEALFRSTIGGV